MQRLLIIRTANGPGGCEICLLALAGDNPLGVVRAFDPGEDRQFGIMPAGLAMPVDSSVFNVENELGVDAV